MTKREELLIKYKKLLEISNRQLPDSPEEFEKERQEMLDNLYSTTVQEPLIYF